MSKFNLVIMNGHVSLTSEAHNTQFVQTFGDLFRNKILTDVTLLCEDRFKIEAHKVVLCAGSNFFREFFTNNTRDNLVLYMREIRKHQLMPLIQFLYCGETTVPNNQVKEVLKIAKELEISALDEAKLKSDNSPSFENKHTRVFKGLRKESSSFQDKKNEPDFASMPELSCQYCKFVGFNMESFEKHKKFAHKERATENISPSLDSQKKESLLELTVDGDNDQDHQKYFDANLVLQNKPRSQYWTYFKFAGTDFKGPAKILHCMLCLVSNDVRMRKKDLHWTGGTTNIKRHMEIYHEDIIARMENPNDEHKL